MQEAYNITCKATIVDEETLAPISQSTIHSECIFQQNIDESSAESVITQTDSIGYFEINFKKGYRINMVFGAKDYLANRIQFNPRSELMPDTIYLTKKIYFETSALILKSDLLPLSALE
jgi:hypothetical protein